MEKLVQCSVILCPKDSLASFILGSRIGTSGRVPYIQWARTLWPHTAGALYYQMNDNYRRIMWSWQIIMVSSNLSTVRAKSFAPLAAVMLFDRSNLSSPRSPVFLSIYTRRLPNDGEKSYQGQEMSIYNTTTRHVATHTFNGTGDENVVKKIRRNKSE